MNPNPLSSLTPVPANSPAPTRGGEASSSSASENFGQVMARVGNDAKARDDASAPRRSDTRRNPDAGRPEDSQPARDTARPNDAEAAEQPADDAGATEDALPGESTAAEDGTPAGKRAAAKSRRAAEPSVADPQLPAAIAVQPAAASAADRDADAAADNGVDAEPLPGRSHMKPSSANDVASAQAARSIANAPQRSAESSAEAVGKTSEAAGRIAAATSADAGATKAPSAEGTAKRAATPTAPVSVPASSSVANGPDVRLPEASKAGAGGFGSDAASRLLHATGDSTRTSRDDLRVSAPVALPQRAPIAEALSAALAGNAEKAAAAVGTGPEDRIPDALLAARAASAPRMEPSAGAVALSSVLNASPNASPNPVSHAAVSTPVGDPGFSQDLGQRLVVLATSHVKSAELALHPAELGPLRVSIEIRGQDASVSFIAHAAHARAAIEDALPRLREMFAQQGLNLADANVGAQTHQQSARGYREQAARGGRTTAAVAAVDSVDGSALPVAGRTVRLIDVVA